MNIGKTLYRTALSGCISFATASSAFGEPYSLLELPPQRSTKEAFLKYSRPLEEADKERLQKLRELGYNEMFRVVSFDTICDGLGKSKEDFNGCIKDYEKVLESCIKVIPCSFCYCDTENKIYDFLPLPPNAIEDKKRSFLACLRLKPWWEKSKQILALYDLLLRDKVELKFMVKGGGFCYVKAVGDDRRYVIHFAENEIFHHSLLAHEMKHALYYELGLSGDLALCSYTTKFIRDVYRLPQNFSSGSVTERSVEAIYNQCPAIAMDCDTIEEAWNKLGFIEIGGVVYINELSDFVFPDPWKDGRSVISYHKPLFMRSYIYDSKERLKNFAGRQNKLIQADRGVGEKIIEFSDSDDEEKGKGEQSEKNEDVPYYLKAISAAFNISYISGSAQVDCRRSYMESVKADREWYRKLKKMHSDTSDGKFSKK